MFNDCEHPPLNAGWWQYNVPYIAVMKEKTGDPALYASATYIAGDGSAKYFPLHSSYAAPLSEYEGYYDAYLDGHLSLNKSLNQGSSLPDTVYVMKPNGVQYIFNRPDYADFLTNGYYGYVFRLIGITNSSTDDTIRFIYSDEFDLLLKIKTDADSILFKYTNDNAELLDTIIRTDDSKLSFSDYECQGGIWKAFRQVKNEQTGLVTRFKYYAIYSEWHFRPDSVISFTGAKTHFTYEEDSLLEKKVVFDPVTSTKDSTEFSLTEYKNYGYTNKDSVIIIKTMNNTFASRYKFLEYILGCDSEDTVSTNILTMRKTPIDSTNYFWKGEAVWGEDNFGGMPGLIKNLNYRFGNSYKDSTDYEQSSWMAGSQSYNAPYVTYYKDPLGNIHTASYFHRLIEPDIDGYETCLPETTYYLNNTKGINVFDEYNSIYTHCKLEEQYFKDSQNNSTRLAKHFYDEHGNDTTLVNVFDDTTRLHYKDVTAGGETFKSYHNVFSTRTTDPMLLKSYRGYDDITGKLIKQMDPNDNITRYEYDGIGRITKVIRPGDSSNSPTIRYTYDDSNRKKYVTIRRAAGDTTRYCYTYNTFRQLIRVYDCTAEGEPSVEYYYDSFGDIVKTVDPENRTIYYRYYSNTRLLKAVVLPDDTPSDTTNNPLITYSYSTENYQLPLHSGTYIFVDKKLTIDPEGNKTMHITDALGQLRETREYISTGQYNDANGNYDRVLYDYDAMGNMTKVRDERGHDKNYTYDDRNRVTATDDPDREGMKNKYDDLNRLTETQPHKYLEDSLWIHFEYDSLSRNTMIWSDDTIVQSQDTTWEMFDDFEDGIVGWVAESKTKIEWESGGYDDAHSMKIGQITQGSTNITAAHKDFSLSGGNAPYCSVRLRVKAYTTQNDHYVKVELRDSGGVVKWNEVNVSSSTQWLTLQLSCDDVNPEDVTYIRIINYLKTGEDVSSVKVDNVEKGYVWKEKVFAKKLYDEKVSPTNPYAPPSGFYSSAPNLKGRLSAVFYSNSGDSTNFDAVECYEYDSRGRPSHKGVRLIVDGEPKWYEIRYEYDSANNLTAITYPDGSKVSYDYNARNRLSEVSDGGDISYNTFTYDASGLDTMENYGNTGSALFEYNASGLLKSMNIKMPSPFGPYSVFRRNYEYDKSGNLTYEKKDLTTYANYEYDALYRLTKEQYPQDNNWLTTYTYDRTGNRKSANLTQYTIDGNNNRLVSQGGNYYYYNEDGNLDSLVNGASITTLDYDFIDKLIQVNEPGGDTTKYYYDGNGLRIKKWYRKNEFVPEGKSLVGIDTDTGFVATGEGGTPSYTITERYYIHSGPGMVLVQDDNTPNFLTNPSFENGATGWSVYVPGQASNNWEIDNSDSYAGSYSLKSASYSDTTYESYYQKFYLSDINLKIPFILSAYVKTEGRVTGNGAQILVQYEDSNSTIKAYASDYITRASDWTKVDLVVDSVPPDSAIKICITLRRYKGNGTIRFDAVRFENGATRTPEVKYIYGGGKRIASEKDGGIYYYHPDRLGSVRLITDESGTVLKRYNYTAFGSVLSDSGSFDNDYRYTSQAIDENDLYYMHARFYDNSIGRFLSTDPFPGYRSIPSTMHPYNYCGNNPVNFVDPLGMDKDWNLPPGWGGNGTGADPIYGYDYTYANTNGNSSSNDLNHPEYYTSYAFSRWLHAVNEQGWRLAGALERGYIQLDASDFVTPNQQDKERNDLTPKGEFISKIILTIGDVLRSPYFPTFPSYQTQFTPIPSHVITTVYGPLAETAWEHREEILEAIDQTLIEVGTRGDQPPVFTLIGGAYIIGKGSIILIEDSINKNINSPVRYPPIHEGVNFYSPPANATIPR